MREDGQSEVDVAAMADGHRQVELTIPVARLTRLAALLAGADGVVSGSVALSRETGRIIADVRFEAELALMCQRCLGPMTQSLEGGSRVALVESEEAALSVPSELETALAPNGRLRLAELVEEELLLALPAAPRHADGECPAAGPETREEAAASDVQRPFANLGELLSGRSKH